MEELTKLNQWINYKRKDKTPCGSIKNLGISFREVVHKMELNCKNIGVGFILTEDDPFICIDLDHCVMKNGKIDPDVKKIIKTMNTYTELSPNDGVHIWLKGKLPKAGYKSGRFEVYQSGRYMTVTMNPIGDTMEIMERQNELDKLMVQMRITTN